MCILLRLNGALRADLVRRCALRHAVDDVIAFEVHDVTGIYPAVDRGMTSGIAACGRQLVGRCAVLTFDLRLWSFRDEAPTSIVQPGRGQPEVCPR